MCCKCLYGILFIIFCILIYFFIPIEDLAIWITALSTLAMAIIAGIALKSWKNELKAKKRIEVYNRLHLLVFELSKMLQRVSILQNDGEKLDYSQKIGDFSPKFELLKSELKIINNKMLYEKLANCIENITSFFAIGQEQKNAENGYNFQLTIDLFANRYINDNKFKERLDMELDEIKQICEQEQLQFYK